MGRYHTYRMDLNNMLSARITMAVSAIDRSGLAAAIDEQPIHSEVVR